MPVLKLPAGGLTACNRDTDGQTTTGWGDFEEDNWVPFWEVGQNDTLVGQNDTMDDQNDTIKNEINAELNETKERRKRELEKEEGIFAPLFSKISYLSFIF